MREECSMAASAVSAPTVTPPSGFVWMPRNSLIPRRSSTYGGVNSFCFIDGKRSVPPATTLTWSVCIDSRATASSRFLGRSNRKLGKLTAHLQQPRHVVRDLPDDVLALYRGTKANHRVRESSSVESGRRLPSSRSFSCLVLPAGLPTPVRE